MQGNCEKIWQNFDQTIQTTLDRDGILFFRGMEFFGKKKQDWFNTCFMFCKRFFGMQCLLKIKPSYCVTPIFFEMAAMPFPCYGPLLCCVNLPKCFSVNLLIVLSLIKIKIFLLGMAKCCQPLDSPKVSRML